MHVQFKDGKYIELIGNIKFSYNVYQKAETLSLEQKQQFNVYEVLDAERPELPLDKKFGNPIYSIEGIYAIRSYEILDKTQEDYQQEQQVKLDVAKQQRQVEVDNIKVTTASGKVFDGDERSQDRMSRAINALNPLEETLWVLADNSPVLVAREEIQEALRLAGAAQTAIWIRPYL